MEKMSGIRRLIKAFEYSISGLKAAWTGEEAFRQETLISVPIIVTGLWLGGTWTQRALLIGSWCIVIITELINSAIEAITDRIGSDHHTLSGRAKDMGSAAVLMSICMCIIIWGIIAVERFLN